MAKPSAWSCCAQPPSGVVQRLVQGAAGSAPALRQDVDRDLVQRQRGEHPSLVLRQAVEPRRSASRSSRASPSEAASSAGQRSGSVAARAPWRPARRTCTAASYQAELGRPGREPAAAGVLVELAQDGDQGIAGRALGELPTLVTRRTRHSSGGAPRSPPPAGAARAAGPRRRRAPRRRPAGLAQPAPGRGIQGGDGELGLELWHGGEGSARCHMPSERRGCVRSYAGW